MERDGVIDISAFAQRILHPETIPIEQGEQLRDLDVIPQGTFEAPQFILQRGAELGYHCHVYRTIGNKDLGLMVTMFGNMIFVEVHRSGKVKKPYDVNQIGEKEKMDLIREAKSHLSSIPTEARRKPGKKATLLRLSEDA